MNKRIFVSVVDGVEELELVAPVDVLRRAGVDVVLVSMTEQKKFQTRNGLVIEADALYGDVEVAGFDGILVPGGPGVAALRASGEVAELARDFIDAGKLVAAICAAPLLLKDAGILAGARFTAHYSTQGELTEAELEEKVLVSGAIITSRGAGTALEFGLAIVEYLCGKEVRQRVEKEVML